MAINRTDPRVLHVFDCADVASTLVRSGRVEGLPWRHLDMRDTSGDTRGLLGPARRLAGVGGWKVRRRVEFQRADLLHIHFGTRVNIAQAAPGRPFVVHFHGTDIREFYRDPAQRERVQWGADHARAVFYATPDLAEHAREARPDALYLANPVDLSELPEWTPRPEVSVVFASRWSGAKGGGRQLELAESLVRALAGSGVQVQGLQWGENASRAAAAGVRLIPQMDKPAYLRWLAGAHAVVGQSTGLLGMSELQALAIGVPTVMELRTELYPGTVPILSPPSVQEQTAAIVEVLRDPARSSQELDARRWVREHHDPRVIARTLADHYRSLDLDAGADAG